MALSWVRIFQELMSLSNFLTCGSFVQSIGRHMLWKCRVDLGHIFLPPYVFHFILIFCHILGEPSNKSMYGNAKTHEIFLGETHSELSSRVLWKRNYCFIAHASFLCIRSFRYRGVASETINATLCYLLRCFIQYFSRNYNSINIMRVINLWRLFLGLASQNEA